MSQTNEHEVTISASLRVDLSRLKDTYFEVLGKTATNEEIIRLLNLNPDLLQRIFGIGEIETEVGEEFYLWLQKMSTQSETPKVQLPYPNLVYKAVTARNKQLDSSLGSRLKKAIGKVSTKHLLQIQQAFPDWKPSVSILSVYLENLGPVNTDYNYLEEGAALDQLGRISDFRVALEKLEKIVGIDG